MMHQVLEVQRDAHGRSERREMHTGAQREGIVHLERKRTPGHSECGGTLAGAGRIQGCSSANSI